MFTRSKIKVWDMEAAVDTQSRATQFCLKTLEEHKGRVFRLQFDDFQIVSSSHDDTILIWDFSHPLVCGASEDPSTAGQEDEAGAGENDDGFFNDEAALAAATANNTNNTNSAVAPAPPPHPHGRPQPPP